MKTTRLEAFSDGVLAIIITIMVLELKVPHATELTALKPMLPVLLSYVLSFIYLGIYWNNHHHLFQAAKEVSGGILWANLHLLFWLSLFPFTTGWMGENHLAPTPTAVYGFVLLMAAIAYYILQRTIIAKEGRDSLIRAAVGRDWKGKLSPVLYLIAIPLAFVNSWIAGGLYVFVALLWLIPDPRIERELEKREESASAHAFRYCSDARIKIEAFVCTYFEGPFQVSIGIQPYEQTIERDNNDYSQHHRSAQYFHGVAAHADVANALAFAGCSHIHLTWT